MIDRQGGRILIECDSCDEVLDTETNNFAEALGVMRREDWTAEKIGAEWLHGCPHCGVPK